MRSALSLARPVLVLALLPLLLATRCEILSPNDRTAVERELRVAERKWELVRPEEYRIVQHRGCECLPGMGGTMLVDVQGTEVVAVRHVESGDHVDPRYRDNYHSIDGLFALIRNAISVDVHDLQVSYHPTLGYPTSVFVDYSHPVVDDEVSYLVTSLTPLN